MCPLFYFSKCSFSFRLSDDESTNLFAFRIFFFLNFFLTFLVCSACCWLYFSSLFGIYVSCFGSLAPFVIIDFLSLLLIRHIYEIYQDG